MHLNTTTSLLIFVSKISLPPQEIPFSGDTRRQMCFISLNFRVRLVSCTYEVRWPRCYISKSKILSHQRLFVPKFALFYTFYIQNRIRKLQSQFACWERNASWNKFRTLHLDCFAAWILYSTAASSPLWKVLTMPLVLRIKFHARLRGTATLHWPNSIQAVPVPKPEPRRPLAVTNAE